MKLSKSIAAALALSWTSATTTKVLAHDGCTKRSSDKFAASMMKQRDEAPAIDLSGWFNVTRYPNEQKQNVTKYLVEAQELAGDDLWADYKHRCIASAVYPELSSLTQSPGFITPRSPFRKVFFVGQSNWSSWAIDTGAGILLIDTLESSWEAEHIILPGLARFGFSGKDIRWIYITHEHGDHYLGARWLQENFPNQIRVMASETAWGTMVEDPEGPIRDELSQVLGEGEVRRFGDFGPVTFYLTPGHTDGAVSSTFPVVDEGTGSVYLAGFFGGMGIPDGSEDMGKQIKSLERFADIAGELGVEVLMANHQTQDRSIYYFDVLDHRDCSSSSGGRRRGQGKCNVGNPFVVGTDRFMRYFQVQALCVRTMAGRLGTDLFV